MAPTSVDTMHTAVRKTLDSLENIVKRECAGYQPIHIHKWSALQKLGVADKQFVAFGNDANDMTMFQHAIHSVMIGNYAELASFAAERVPLEEDYETIRKLLRL